jgi:hypothetical protein
MNATPNPVIGVVMFAISLSTATCVWNLPETKGLNMGAAMHHPKRLDPAIDEGSERSSLCFVRKPTYDV